MSVLIDDRNRLIGENIRKYRMLQGLTQDELADGLCSVSQLSKVENGKTFLKRTLLQQIADRLGVPMNRIENADALLEDLSEHVQLAKDAIAAEKYDMALQLSEQALGQTHDLGFLELYADAYLTKCRALIVLQRVEEAIQLLEQALETKVPQNPTQQLMYLFRLGAAYELSGHKRNAFDAYWRAYEQFELADGNLDNKFFITFYIGKHYFYMNNNRSALSFLEKALQMASEIPMHLWRVRTHYMMASTLRKLGQWERGEQLFVQSLKEAEDNNFQLDVAIINHNMGCMYQELTEYGMAQAHFKRAVWVFEFCKQEAYLCAPLHHLAEVAFARNEMEEALRYLDRVFELVSQSTFFSHLELANATRLRGQICLSQGQAEAYVDHLQAALQTYEQHRSYLEAYEVAKELAAYFYDTRDERALEMYRKVVEYNEGSLAVNGRSPW